MANQLYNYGSGLGGSALSGYSARYSSADPYDASFLGASRYLSSSEDAARLSSFDRNATSSLYLNAGDTLRARLGALDSGYGAGKIPGTGIGMGSGYLGMDGLGAASLLDPTGGIKRHADALYHQSVLASNTVGQSEGLFSTNTLVKRPRIETASHLPIYPQRPGEKDCTHYMLTRTCKFGDACKFDHPIWVPEGGIPDWKEVPTPYASDSLPERPGESDCPYYMKTLKCKFGVRCKFNHPKDKIDGISDPSVLPERPTEPLCTFYSKTGKCKFGANCIYNHPKDLQIPASGLDSNAEKTTAVTTDGESDPLKDNTPFTPALLHNSKGLPIRPGEQDCPFYLKTGSCKYGATCRYNHPDRTAINPPVVGTIGATAFQTSSVVNPAASLIPNVDPRLTQTMLGASTLFYPQRPGELECDFYMKTGICKFAERCKFHHPIDRAAHTATGVKQNVKLTLAGLPRHEGQIICPYYLKTATCKFGANCRFDHPPPAEVMSMAGASGTATASAAADGEVNDAGNGANDD